MRLNKFVAQATGMSRRSADEAITQGRIAINGKPARLGQSLQEGDSVTLDGKKLNPSTYRYLLLNKRVGYLSSRKGQEAPTLYELLPPELRSLKIVGRLDKNTSGIILLTNDGDYANELLHPRYQKVKRYRMQLNKRLSADDLEAINRGVELEDGVSRMSVELAADGWYHVTMSEGRNRQIRRTLTALDYKVTTLHRTDLGPYSETDLNGSMYAEVDKR